MKKNEVATNEQNDTETKLKNIADRMDEINARMENLSMEGEDNDDISKPLNNLASMIGEFEQEVKDLRDILKQRENSGEDLSKEIDKLEIYLSVLTGLREGLSS